MSTVDKFPLLLLDGWFFVTFVGDPFWEALLSSIDEEGSTGIAIDLFECYGISDNSSILLS